MKTPKLKCENNKEMCVKVIDAAYPDQKQFENAKDNLVNQSKPKTQK